MGSDEDDIPTAASKDTEERRDLEGGLCATPFAAMYLQDGVCVLATGQFRDPQK